MPRLYLIAQDQPNAFATGRNGLLKIMDPDEIKGVIAHELVHIKNRDILIGSLAATFAGAITMLATMAQWSLIFGGGSRSEDEDEDGHAGNIAGSFLLMILAPLAASLIQMSISRNRVTWLMLRLPKPWVAPTGGYPNGSQPCRLPSIYRSALEG